MKDYDRVRNELVMENTDLKTFILKIMIIIDEKMAESNNKYGDMIDFEKLLFGSNFDEVYKDLNFVFEKFINSLNFS